MIIRMDVRSGRSHHTRFCPSTSPQEAPKALELKPLKRMISTNEIIARFSSQAKEEAYGR
jgi:hypothetical protein